MYDPASPKKLGGDGLSSDPNSGLMFQPNVGTPFLANRSAPENKSAVAIIRYDVIVRFHLDRDRRERLVAHSGNMKMSFALTIQILFAQVRMAALQDRG